MRSRPLSVLLPLSLSFLGFSPANAMSQALVIDSAKISYQQGGFTGTLDDRDSFGVGSAALGDIDGDGIGDLAVGAPRDDDGASDAGAVWIVFLNSDGTAKGQQKINSTTGGFTGDLDLEDFFGSYLAPMGDRDGDGVGDLAVGAILDDDGGADRGAVWLIDLNPDGTVKANRKISDTAGGFTGSLSNGDLFGAAAALLGDLDGDGVADLAVGARSDDDGGEASGAVWILFLNADGTVKSHQKISDTVGGLGGGLRAGDHFGMSSAALGDMDGDSVTDLAVGAYQDDDGGTDRGAVWILYLNADGTVKAHQKISDTQGGFEGVLDNGDVFGKSVANMGDMDGDGVVDIAVGATGDDDGGEERGATWLLFLNADGTVKSYQKFSDLEGGLQGALDSSVYFGSSVTKLPDMDGNGITDLAVGAHYADGGGGRHQCGAMWVLFLNAEGGGGGGPQEMTLDDARGLPQNEEFPVTLSLTNSVPARGVQVTVRDVPDLLRVREVIPTGRAAGLQASFSDEDEATIVLYGLEGQVITPGTGTILTLLVDIPGPAPLGTVIELEGVEAFFSDNNGNTDTLEVSSGSVVVGRISGDITGDNRVDVGDVVRLVEIIVGEDAPPTPEELSEADCNEDGGINVGDITCLVDKVLAAPMLPGGAPGPTAAPLTIVNDVEVRGFQFTTRGSVESTGDLAPFRLHTVTRATGTAVVAFDPAGGKWAAGTRTPLLTNVPAERVAESFRAYGPQGEPLKITASGSEIRVGPTRVTPTLRMLANRPNPFPSSTSIRFATDRPGKARVAIYDVQGRMVAVLPERRVEAGESVWNWSAIDDAGRPLPAGIYLATVEFETQRASIRITHLGR